LLFEHSSLWDLKQCKKKNKEKIWKIWTFFPMGFETTFFAVLDNYILYLNILPYGIWNSEKDGKVTLAEHLNILPYGIWNIVFDEQHIVHQSFEHSSLWDLKLNSWLSDCRCSYHLNILPYGIWNEKKWPKLIITC